MRRLYSDSGMQGVLTIWERDEYDLMHPLDRRGHRLPMPAADIPTYQQLIDAGERLSEALESDVLRSHIHELEQRLMRADL